MLSLEELWLWDWLENHHFISQWRIHFNIKIKNQTRRKIGREYEKDVSEIQQKCQPSFWKGSMHFHRKKSSFWCGHWKCKKENLPVLVQSGYCKASRKYKWSKTSTNRTKTVFIPRCVHNWKKNKWKTETQTFSDFKQKQDVRKV